MQISPLEYQEAAIKTEAPIDKETKYRMVSCARINHALTGLQTEAGELADNFKGYIYYNRSVPRDNVREELGDLLWYIAVLCDEMNFELDDVMARNIAKLKARYPGKFTQEDAINRDLGVEQQILSERLQPDGCTLEPESDLARLTREANEKLETKASIPKYGINIDE